MAEPLQPISRSLEDEATQLLNLADALPTLFNEGTLATLSHKISDNGYLNAEEDYQLKAWFAHFLTLRNHLLDIAYQVESQFNGQTKNINSDEDWRYFIVGYAAACLAIKYNRQLMAQATHKKIQRKLNEASPEFRYPRKQFTETFKQMLSVRNALTLLKVRHFAQHYHDKINQFANDTLLQPIIAQLPEWQLALSVKLTLWGKWRLFYRRHAVKRKVASGRENIEFAFLEYSGRLIAEMRLPKPHRVSTLVIADTKQLIQAGDIFITRHDAVASNYFLPGFWPHCAFYMGDGTERAALGVEPDKIAAEFSVIEALKNGVNAKPLEEMLAVDCFVIVRPLLDKSQIKVAIERAISHLGKPYNFDFNFFTSDKLVCTEVVYRAFDGLTGVHIPLKKRAGRFTFSAEDLLDLALQEQDFSIVAVYGLGKSTTQLISDTQTAIDIVRKSYHSNPQATQPAEQ